MRRGVSAMATTTGYHHALPAVTACAQAAALLNVRRGVSAIVESTTVCRWWYVAGWCSVSSAGGKRLCLGEG